MKTIDTTTLGGRIKGKRIELGLSQEKLSELMHVSFKTISAYERDQIDIKSSVIMELCNILNTTPNYLLGYKSETDAESENIIASIAKISDPKVKELLIMQIKTAANMKL